MSTTSEGALRGRLLAAWRRGLTTDDHSDPTDVVVAELSDYFELPPEEVRERCVNWKRYSLEEWQRGDRSTPDGLVDFYQTQTSWIFDTMWYHANQYHGTAPAESVEIVAGLTERDPTFVPGDMLDFGAGPGSSVLFFHELGWRVSLADISTTMLDFARWRLGRHGVPATFYDLTRERLPTAAYDLITAFDVMVHVPNPAETLTELHRALRPGGYLAFNIHNLPQTLDNHGHLYADQWPILRHARRIGFRRHPKVTFFHLYQKVDRGPIETRAVALYDRLRYNWAVSRVGDLARAARGRLASRGDGTDGANVPGTAT